MPLTVSITSHTCIERDRSDIAVARWLDSCIYVPNPSTTFNLSVPGLSFWKRKIMASNPVLFLFLLSFLLLVSVSSSHFSSVAMKSGPLHSKKNAVANPEKVSLSLYYETLCPYCRNFIVDPLAKAINTDLMTILDLEMVPWGNAMILPNTSILCQVHFFLHLNCTVHLNPINQISTWFLAAWGRRMLP